MLDRGRDSDSELSLEAVNSGYSSMSSDSCSSFSRLSFELIVPPSQSSPENNHLTLKPHRSSDSAYSAVRRTGLTFRDFRLIRRIGAGDIGGGQGGLGEEEESCRERKMERKIVKMLDHPFLPTLHAEFEASHFSCIVMEYCSGGDLHSLRHKLLHKRFSLNSARFYAAEILVALEYLHMLGIIYRDLKPENVLVRSDGHIMLSDFDLSLCSDAIPAVESPSYSPDTETPSTPSYSRGAHNPFSCLPNRLFRSRKVQTMIPNRLFVAEPVHARSCSFVGTHEYVSPEVASGGSHGNAVDWWAFGIFIYEMIYGRTPFAAPSNETTLRNIIKKPLQFPTHTPSSAIEHHARDLITGLLNKDPVSRLGSKRGAADVKKHAFFKNLNFALIRSLTPPEIPGVTRIKTTPSSSSTNAVQSTAFEESLGDMEKVGARLPNNQEEETYDT
uniref:non-specific serine/threonine protein kinase n=1 Tax=Fagus sylvatica TaxID=28930 RepID=A0A2N9GAQ3_FAGSY